ncbi:MAG: (2Fe-2S)-binding protein [Pseudomonadota bacterium]
MYVCICNALKDKELAAAAKKDAVSVGDVFRRCGTRPQCGKCLPDVAKIIEKERVQAQPALAAE